MKSTSEGTVLCLEVKAENVVSEKQELRLRLGRIRAQSKYLGRS